MRNFIIVTVLLLSGITYSEMIIRTVSGNEIKVDVSKEDILSIEFQSSLSAATDKNLIFEDDFELGSLENWKGSADGIKVVNGVAQFYSRNHSTFELKSMIPTENVVIEWKGSADTNGFHGAFGLYSFAYGAYNNTASAFSGPDYPSKRTANGKVYVPNEFQIYKIERNGDNFRAFLDGRIIFEDVIKGKSEKSIDILKFTSYFSTLKIDWIKVYRP